MKRQNYYSDKEWMDLLNFSDPLATPFIIIKQERIKKKFMELSDYFPGSQIYYPVKANPAPDIISLLHRLGSRFNIGSIYELNNVMTLGVSADNLLFGNTIKKASDIAYAFQKGIRLFATDSLSDLENIALHAPGSNVCIRILVQGGETADWPLSRKHGCHPMMGVSLIKSAVKLGLKPYGISFHVGSQQRAIWQWESALATAAELFTLAKGKCLPIPMINMVGGFPANYINKTRSLKEYADAINSYLNKYFAEQIPTLLLEPGRSLVANAGVLVTEVIMVSKKSASDGHRWVYLDAGKFNGLMETLDENIKYPVVMAQDNDTMRVGEVILGGPTDESTDILYEKARYKLPLDIRSGQRLYWLSAGAYTASYATASFNGFPTIHCHFMA